MAEIRNNKKVYIILLIAIVCVISALTFGFMRFNALQEFDGVVEADSQLLEQNSRLLIDIDKIMYTMFPNENFEKKGKWYLTKSGGGQSYCIESIIPGSFINKERNELLVAVYRPGVAHAEGLYHLYMAVFDNENGELLSEVMHFFADEGKYRLFESQGKAYVFFAGSVTYQGWTEWDGGLWEAGSTWKKKWPEVNEYWKDKAIEFDQHGLKVLKRELLPKKNNSGAIPDYLWEYAYSLYWDESDATFRVFVDDLELH